MKGLSRTTRRVVVCVAIGLVVCTSCGDDDESSSTVAATTVVESTSAAPTVASVSPAASSSTPAASAGSGDMCADREALSSSVAAIGDVDLVAEGTNGVTAAVDAVKDDLAALRGSVSAELRPQVQAVQDALDELETAAADLGSGGAAATATAVSNLATVAGTLLDSLQAGVCGEAPPPYNLSHAWSVWTGGISYHPRSQWSGRGDSNPLLPKLKSARLAGDIRCRRVPDRPSGQRYREQGDTARTCPTRVGLIHH